MATHADKVPKAVGAYEEPVPPKVTGSGKPVLATFTQFQEAAVVPVVKTTVTIAVAFDTELPVKPTVQIVLPPLDSTVMAVLLPADPFTLLL